MIEVENLSFTYAGQKKPALKIPHLEIAAGRCVVLTGISGSGKSTFLRVLNGLIPEYFPGNLQGKVTLNQQDLTQQSVEEIAAQVGSVFQNPRRQFFFAKVSDELAFPAENQGQAPEQIWRQLRLTEQELGLAGLLSAQLAELSGGQKQRVALAAAQMQRPQILVLDEPTANLDNQGIALLQANLAKLKAQGLTIIIAEHRLDYLREVADDYYYFTAGEIKRSWTKAEWLKLTDRQRLAYGLRLLQVETFSKARLQVSGQNTLALKDLTLKWHQQELGWLKEFSLTSGIIYGLTGANGLGKTSLAKVLVGLKKARSHLTWNGRALTQRALLAKSSLLMQDVSQQLFLPTVQAELNASGATEQEVTAMAAKLDLSELLASHPFSLSGGQQQRVALGRALLAQKELFILDEPTSGLDEQNMRRVADLLLELKSSKRIVMVISHDQELINLTCDEVLNLSDFLTKK